MCKSAREALDLDERSAHELFLGDPDVCYMITVDLGCRAPDLARAVLDPAAEVARLRALTRTEAPHVRDDS